MATGLFRIAAVGGIAALLCAGCGGGGGSTAAIPAGANGGSVTPANFSGLAAAPMAVGDSRQFTPAESGYSGAYTVTSSAPNVVGVTPGSGTGPFTATAASQGAATISIADSLGHTSTVPISVGTIGFGSLQSTTMTPGSTQQFTPSESGNTQFNVSSSAPNIVAVSPASGAGPFTLTAGTAGSATITVADNNGGHSSATITVAASGGSNPSGLTLSPQSLTVPLSQLGTDTVTDNLGGTALTATVANPAIATVVPSGNNSVTVVGNQAGSTTATVTDNLGNSATLPIAVPVSPAPAISLNAVGDTNGATNVGVNAVVLTPTEAGYLGPFTASVTGSNATVTPVGNAFNVSVNAPGSSIVTVSDNQGHSSSIGLTAP